MILPPLGQTLPFVHPAIAGIAAACGLIPVLIHLISRRRYRRVRWAAMPFLLAANRYSARRLRLENWLLMLARVGLIVLFGLAVARPFVPARYSAAGSIFGSSRVHRVILLDNSLSMNTRTSEGSRFDSARACASRLVASFPPGDPVSLVTLAAPAEAVIEHGDFDRRLVRERLDTVRQTQRSGDTNGALGVAREILKASEAAPGNRALYLISDFPRGQWTGPVRTASAGWGGWADTGESDHHPAGDDPTEAVRTMRLVADALGDPATDLNLIRVYAPSRVGQEAAAEGAERLGPAANVAVTALACESTLISVDWPVAISARVSNFGPSAARGLVLQWRRDGAIVRDESIPEIAPGGWAEVTASMAFSRGGSHSICARLVTRSEEVAPDGLKAARGSSTAPLPTLPDDDARYLSIDVRESTRVLLVDGRRGARPLEGEAGFLATALAPGSEGVWSSPLGRGVSPARGQTPTDGRPEDAGDRRALAVVEPKIVSRDEIEAETLSEYDAIALCDVPSLSPQQWEQLERFAAGGGGLLIFGGDLVNIDNYNRFGYAEGHGLLPGKIGRSRAHNAGSTGVGGGPFNVKNFIHPLVAEFADHPTSGLLSPTARVDRYLPVELDRRRGEVVLEYTNGDPALVASSYRKGRVLLCTTTANMAWNNLPARGDYVSLMLNAVAFLAPQRGEHRNLLVGQTVREPLSAVETTMSLGVSAEDAPVSGSARPSGSAGGTLVPYEEGLALEYGPVEHAGLMELSVGPQRRVVAVNVDAAESDIEGVSSAAELAAGLHRPFRWMTDGEVRGESQDAGRATELATIPLVLVLALVLVELWLGMWFGVPRGVKPAARNGVAHRFSGGGFESR